MNKQQKYNEYSVSLNKGEIVEKMPTLRKTVMIYPHEAEWYNKRINQNKLYYELAEEKSKYDREALEKEANENGITFRANISDAKLSDKIEEFNKTKENE